MAKLYYLENSVPTYNDQAKYFVNGGDAGGDQITKILT